MYRPSIVQSLLLQIPTSFIECLLACSSPNQLSFFLLMREMSINYLPTYLHTYIPTYLHTYIPTYLHTYIPTYIHTYHETVHVIDPTYMYLFIYVLYPVW
ncbi:hypothetical protein V8F06_007741 [Rhypophila decipiens]